MARSARGTTEIINPVQRVTRISLFQRHQPYEQNQLHFSQNGAILKNKQAP